MKKNILIIGGTGFIGYHLAYECVKKGWEVTSISTKKPKKNRYVKKVKYIYCDISKKKILNKKIPKKKNYDYIVNLGGYVDHSNKQKTYSSHYLGVKNLANFFLNNQPKLFIQFGSGGEYGDLKSPHKEVIIKKKLSNYYKAKFLASSFLLQLYKNNKFPSVILRLYQAYGKNQDLNRLIPIVIKSCLENKKFACTSGSQVRDFIHINDVISAIFKIINNKEKVIGEVFNIGSGQPIKVKYVINKIQKLIGRGIPLFGKIKPRMDEKSRTFPNIKKAVRILKWYPKIKFSKGIISTINSYK